MDLEPYPGCEAEIPCRDLVGLGYDGEPAVAFTVCGDAVTACEVLDVEPPPPTDTGEPPPPADGTGPTPDPEPDPGTSSGAGTSGESSEGTEAGAGGQMLAGRGCGCASGLAHAGWLWLLVLAWRRKTEDAAPRRGQEDHDANPPPRPFRAVRVRR
jgi:hypothetical protein